MNSTQIQTDTAFLAHVGSGNNIRSRQLQTTTPSRRINRSRAGSLALKAGSLALMATSVAIINSPFDSIGKHDSNKDTAESFIEPAVDVNDSYTDEESTKLLSRVRELAKYSKGWDGNGAFPASEKAVDASEIFLGHLTSNNNIHEPHISLSADGELCFYWHINDFKLDLGFSEDGTYSYYATNEHSGDYISPNDALPYEVMELLKRA